MRWRGGQAVIICGMSGSLEDSTSNTGGLVKKVCVACGQEFDGEITICPNDSTPLTTIKGGTGLVGTVLGDRYEIQELVGDGAMGQVYKARHRLMKRTVAVKMMHANLVSGAAALKRFQKEAELASSLNHPNILTVHDFGLTEDGMPYLVMAFLQGRSLENLLQEQKSLAPIRAVHIFRQIASGLGHAHDHGVVHRDLKPSNVHLVELDGDPDFVKILDFGIAKMLQPLEGEQENLTRTGEVFGSPPYMSPEQCRALPVDGRSDIYSLGCVMYRCLSGINPINGSDLIEFLFKHVNEMPQPFSVICPELEIPQDFEAVVFKCLAKSPEDRFQTMQELRVALDGLSCSPVGLASTTMVSAVTAEQAAEVVARAAQDQAEATLKVNETPTLDKTEVPGSTIVSGKEQAGIATPASAPSPHTKSIGLPLNFKNLSAKNKKIFVGTLSVIGVGIILGIASLSFTQGPDMLSKYQNKALKSYNAGFFPDAEKEARAALRIEALNRLPQSSKSRYILGLVQYADGDYKDAQESLENALAIISKDKSASALDKASIQATLGRTYSALHDFGKAEPLLRESYRLRKESTYDPVDEADSLAGLADLYMRKQEYQKAVVELTSALRIIQAAKGANSSDTATALNDLGQAYQLVGNLATAEDLYKRALKIREKVLQSNNPSLADSYECLAAVYAQRGKLGDAMSCLSKAIEIEKRSLDPSSPRLAATRQRYQELVTRMKSGREYEKH